MGTNSLYAGVLPTADFFPLVTAGQSVQLAPQVMVSLLSVTLIIRVLVLYMWPNGTPITATEIDVCSYLSSLTL